MNKIIIVVLGIVASFQISAQTRMNKYINISLSYGLSSVFDDYNNLSDLSPKGKGFYIQGEYVFEFRRWFEIRSYVGFMNTKTDQNDVVREEYGYKVKFSALLLGGKSRFSIPINWLNPYGEIGFGASYGSFETISEDYSINTHGIIAHIPISMGVVIGSHQNIDVGIHYFLHPAVQQFSGTMAFGLKIPLL